MTPFGIVTFSRRPNVRTTGDLSAWQSDHEGCFAVAFLISHRRYHAAGCFVKPEAANRPDCCRIGLCCVSACQARTLSRRLRQFATGKTARTFYYQKWGTKRAFGQLAERAVASKDDLHGAKHNAVDTDAASILD